ncbi:MAG: aminotransferase class I/II-fold pyridoxal phosphate-dependent enzyme, partial [Lentisphaeria bacterium]|nr:aminotransferase class I/II-fold pyridoxal phosphate-dependent enzyme [Lentisphaeria bacterium]
GNYKLSFCNAYGAQLDTFETFVDGTFNLDGFQEKLNEGNPGKRIVLLNFPNNPSGYTPTEEEAAGIVDILVASATAGNKITVLVDDAYFGLVYKDGIYKESIFAPLADAHENILAVKIDGGTKEDYVWGLRVGFISYAIKGGTETLLKALEAKTAGAIRGNISNSPHISQTILLNAFSHPDYKSQKAEKFAILKGRYDKVVAIFAAHPEYADAFEAVPYNSGYFMCVKLKSADPETVRQLLLAEYDTGLIVAAGLIRVAYSSCAASVLDELFSNLYAAVKKVQV